MKDDIKNKFLAVAVILTVIFTLCTYAIQNIKSIKRLIMTDKQVFTELYNTGEWGGWKGVGPGSTKEDGAIPFLNYLQKFIDSHDDINVIVDMGCGYGELLKDIKLSESTKYLGLDIVDSVIAYNKEHYTRRNFSFNTVNKVEDLANYKGDLLILKDVIQHWNIKQIIFAKQHIIPNFKYAIIVNNVRTAWKNITNSNITTGDSRTLDLQGAPFFMNPEHVEDYLLPPYRIKRIYLFVNKDTVTN